MLFNNAYPHLAKNTQVVLDQSGSLQFNQQITTAVDQSINYPRRGTIIRFVRQCDSAHNNFLQVADYVSSILGQKFHNKKRWQDYYHWLSAHEHYVQEWPKTHSNKL